ncbi:dTDP-4-dehydrorhamnose 3,5-epimerase [Gammaproteobacteria bacterium]|jgi:dTDP-4-dehydrorhamnose 3,5-epimerase|nr:dTDP-4-dehydrorhamnose 3,5-epimerase [Gammaproteobacteria bacterium]
MSLIDISDLEGCSLIPKKTFLDERGSFTELFRASSFPESSFVQDNFSHSKLKGTFRGLHFQSHPFEQAKLVHVITGSILDFFIDLRPNSDTFLDHCSCILSAASHEGLLVPRGFAHGFLTLENDTRVIYKVDNYYSAQHDHSLIWNDTSINLNLSEKEVRHLSEKDRNGMTISKIQTLNLIND